MNIYRRYLTGCFASNVLGSIEGVIATDSMLMSVTDMNTELSVSINFIGKDILGQLGCLGIVKQCGKYSDKTPKKFFRNTFLLQQACLVTESLTWLISDSTSFFITAGLANIGKNVSFINFGAMNAKCIPLIRDKLKEEANKPFCSKPRPGFEDPLDLLEPTVEQQFLNDAQEALIGPKVEVMEVGEIYSKINIISTLGSSIGMAIGLGIILTVPNQGLRTMIIPVVGLAKYFVLKYTFKGLYFE